MKSILDFEHLSIGWPINSGQLRIRMASDFGHRKVSLPRLVCTYTGRSLRATCSLRDRGLFRALQKSRVRSLWFGSVHSKSQFWINNWSAFSAPRVCRRHGRFNSHGKEIAYLRVARWAFANLGGFYKIVRDWEIVKFHLIFLQNGPSWSAGPH